MRRTMTYLSIRNFCLFIFLVSVFSACRTPKTKFDKDYPEYTDQKNTRAYYPVTKDSTTMILSEKSTDEDYGRSPENPIFVGVTTVRDIGTYRMRFLNALEFEDGTPIEYERVRSCCPFKTKNSRTVGPEQKYGLLDVWIVYPKDEIQKADTLYFNPYDEGIPQIPTGYQSIKIATED